MRKISEKTKKMIKKTKSKKTSEITVIITAETKKTNEKRKKITEKIKKIT